MNFSFPLTDIVNGWLILCHTCGHRASRHSLLHLIQQLCFLCKLHYHFIFATNTYITQHMCLGAIALTDMGLSSVRKVNNDALTRHMQTNVYLHLQSYCTAMNRWNQSLNANKVVTNKSLKSRIQNLWITRDYCTLLRCNTISEGLSVFAWIQVSCIHHIFTVHISRADYLVGVISKSCTSHL
jgi:hypothetical protein